MMYRIKIQEGKDRPKDANVKLVFSSKFEGENHNTRRNYTKTSRFISEITVLPHGAGKIVSMDNGFCVRRQCLFTERVKLCQWKVYFL